MLSITTALLVRPWEAFSCKSCQPFDVMSANQNILDEVFAAFGGVEKPRQFMPDLTDYEFADHEELLQSRDVNSLTRHDLRAEWDPLPNCCAQGIAYFFPAMARIALELPDVPWHWYGADMLFHLTYKGAENRFLVYCNNAQKQAVLHLVEYLLVFRSDLVEECVATQEFEECIDLWRVSRE